MAWEGCYIVKGSFKVIPAKEDVLVGKTAIVSLQVARKPRIPLHRVRYLRRMRGSGVEGVPIHISVNGAEVGTFESDYQGNVNQEVLVDVGKNLVVAWIEDTDQRVSQIIPIEGPKTQNEKDLEEKIAGNKAQIREINSDNELKKAKKKPSPVRKKIDELKEQGELVAEEKKLREMAAVVVVKDVLVEKFGSPGRYQLVIQVISEHGGLPDRKLLVKESHNRDSYHCETDPTGHTFVYCEFEELERRYRITDTESGKFKDITLSNI